MVWEGGHQVKVVELDSDRTEGHGRHWLSAARASPSMDLCQCTTRPADQDRVMGLGLLLMLRISRKARRHGQWRWPCQLFFSSNAQESCASIY